MKIACVTPVWIKSRLKKRQRLCRYDKEWEGKKTWVPPLSSESAECKTRRTVLWSQFYWATLRERV